MREAKELVGNEILYGAVLAGGRSTRMGRDKRFLKLDGEFLVDRAIKVVADAISGSTESVYLCGRVPNRDCVVDVLPNLGPLGGILSALQLVRTKNPEQEAWLLVVPVDMPLLNPNPLKDLISAISDIGSNFSRVVAFEDYEMPFIIHCDSFTEKTLTAICHSIRPSERSIRTLKDAVGVHQIPLKSVFFESMLNANSPQDWERTSTGGLS